MRDVARVLLLVTAVAVVFPALAISPQSEHQQRIERRCAEEPDRCEAITSRHEERREQMRALCASDPEQCQARKKEMRARRKACRDDSAACSKHQRQSSTN